MTNAEKYLKEKITEKDIEQLANAINEFYQNNIGLLPVAIQQFFNEVTKPTLTEDERVILRNIDKENYFYIGRDTVLDSLYLLNDSNEQIGIDMFDNLFQFIKERRRI